MNTLLAAATQKLTAWEKLQAVPGNTWLQLIIFVVVIVMLVKAWKTLKELNDVVPWIVLITLGGAVVMYWTYERKEPKLLSPIFDQLAKILPSRIQYKDAPTIK
jgi:energy-coupling factor transporter transmembrane protein EcfT